MRLTAEIWQRRWMTIFLLGNLKPAYEIYDLYEKRVDDRVAKIKD